MVKQKAQEVKSQHLSRKELPSCTLSVVNADIPEALSLAAAEGEALAACFSLLTSPFFAPLPSPPIRFAHFALVASRGHSNGSGSGARGANFRASVKHPVTAAAAAIAGDTKWVRPPLPCRPSKLRLEVDAHRSC
jgi:hypothetical protein